MPETSSPSLASPGLGSLARKPKRGLNQKDSTYLYVGLSLLLHLALLGVTSVTFIRDTWIDPQGAAARKAAAAEQAAKETPASQPAPATTAPAAAATPAPGSAPGSTAAIPAKPAAPASNNAAAATGSKTDQLMNDRKDTPIVKKTTEAAKPNELPKAPDDLGMGLDDLGGSKKK